MMHFVCIVILFFMKRPHTDVHLDNQIPLMIVTELLNAGMNDKAATVFTLANGSLKVGEL
jgi:hypothetical protein